MLVPRGAAHAQVPPDCSGWSQVTAVTGQIIFSYSHTKTTPMIEGGAGPFVKTSQHSATVSSELSRGVQVGAAFEGLATGAASINDSTTNGTNTTTIQGSGGISGGVTSLDIDIASCRYSFFTSPHVNTVTTLPNGQSSQGNSGVGGVFADYRPLVGAPSTLSGNASFPTLPPALGDFYTPGGAQTAGGAATVSWSFTPLVEAVDDDAVDDPCQVPGSVIGCENQSLGEAVDLVGTPFQLHYQSDRVPGRPLANSEAIAHARRLGGWTLSVHHAYDPGANALYLGSGQRRDAVALGEVKRASGDFLIASEGGEEVYVFDPQGRHLRTLHGLTGVSLYTFAYDSQGRLVGITDADGNLTAIERDADGHPTAIVSPYGQRTQLAVDANGYLATITNPAGEAVKLSSTSKGLLTSFTDPNNKTSTFTYDDGGQGRLVRDEDAAGGFQALTRTEATGTHTVARSTAEGRTQKYQVTPRSSGGEDRLITNAAGLETTLSRTAEAARSVRPPDGMESSQEIDPDPRFGRSGAFAKGVTIKTPGGLNFVRSATRTATLADPANPFSLTALNETLTLNGRTYASAYESASLTFTDTTPAGRKSRTTIDVHGRVVREEIPGLFPNTYAYDDRGRLASITQGNGTKARTTQLHYDSAGFLESVIDPLGHTVSLTYHAAGRVTQETLLDGRVIHYAYDANGNPTAITPPGKPDHSFAYSSVDLLSIYSAPVVGSEANQTSYTYNLDRQLTRVARPDGQAVDIGYDPAGRPSTLTLARGSINYAYDAVTGNLSSISAPDGAHLAYVYDGQLPMSETWSGPLIGSVKRTYDNDFRVTSIGTNRSKAINLKYDQDGLLRRAGDLVLSRHTQNGLLLGSHLGQLEDTYAYNTFAEPINYQATFRGSPLYAIHYTRDRLGRIKTKTETTGGETDIFAYSYDVAGRLVKVKKDGVVLSRYTYDSNGNRLSVKRGTKTVTGSYDEQDRLIQYGNKTYVYTANGDLVVAGKTNYQYDALGNLLNVTLPNSTQIAYLVDGRNRRIGKQVNGTLVQGFLYQDSVKPIAELGGSNNVRSRFVYATRVNVPDYMIKGGVTYRIITDQLGSPRLVVDVATGRVAQRMDYDEFGKVINDTRPGFQPFGFAGGLYDRDTKLVRFGARDYDAETGRWTAKDPILFEGRDANLYAYVVNDPVNFTDSTGLQKQPKQFDEKKFADDCGKRVVKKVVEKQLKKWPNAPANKELEDTYKISGEGEKGVKEQAKAVKQAFERGLY